MTTTPNQVEPGRERIPTPDEAYAILLRFNASHFQRVGHEHARYSIPADPQRDDDLLLRAFIADYATLTQQLASAKAEIYKYENDEASVCPEDVGFVEYIKRLTSKLTAAKGEVEQLRTVTEHTCHKVREMATERDTLRAQLNEAKEGITKMADSLSDKADGVREWYAALKGNEYENRILELESQCGVKDKMLEYCAGRSDEATAKYIRTAITTTGNTLVERVKGLEDILWSARDWIEEEECYCSDSNPQCSRCKILKQINAFATPTKATDE